MTKSVDPNVPFKTRAKQALKTLNPLNIPRSAAAVAGEEIERFRDWNKTVDPRTKNLFLGAACITPGFVAAISGAIMYANNLGTMRECEQIEDGSPFVTQEINPQLCQDANKIDQDSKGLMLGGTAAMLLPAMVFIQRDGRLAERADNMTGSGKNVQGGSTLDR